MNVRGIQAALVVLSLLGCAAGCGPRPAAEARTPATVLARNGSVELSRSGGQWSDARVGDQLLPSDALRTEAGEAELGLGAVRMRLHESSAVQLQETSKSSLRARVRGSVESEVEPGRGAVALEVEGTGAVARSSGGHFFVTADGRGIVSVATVTGSVNLVAKSKQVEVKEHEMSRVHGGEPDAPLPALRRVLLSVRWPEELATRNDAVPVSGKVEPGSRVFIQDRLVPVETDGAFTAQVPLHAGAQKVAVLAVDALGRRKQAWATIVREDRHVPAGAEAKAKKKKEWQWR